MSKNVLIDLDKSGAEWVVVAYLTGDSNMLSVVEGDKSPHLITGSLISGAPVNLVEQEDKLVGKSTDPTEIAEAREQLPELDPENMFLPRSMSIRQAGKKSNHGLNYHMQYRRFALENEIQEAEAKKMVAFYLEKAYPGIPVWHSVVQEKLRKDRTLTNCFGRKRTFRDGWGPDLFDAAYAFVPQSTVFDITRIGIVKSWNDPTPAFQKAELLEQVHDSLLFQYPLSDILGMAKFLHVMCEDYMNPLLDYGGREFYIDTDIKIGFNWSDQGMHTFELGKSVGATEDKLKVFLKGISSGEEDS